MDGVLVLFQLVTGPRACIVYISSVSVGDWPQSPHSDLAEIFDWYDHLI